MAEPKRPKIKINPLPEFLRPAPPVTPGDFVEEMARDAVIDLLIQGYHMAPDGTMFLVDDVPIKD